MKKLSLLFALLITLSFLNLKAQDDMMKVWADYMTPGDAHSGMAKMTGDWHMKTTAWMDPSAPPMISDDGTCKVEMVYGGRYMKMTATSSMMGMPFTGEGITGYDNASKVYQATWYDNMGTGLMYMEGTMDPATKLLTLKGISIDPMTKQKINMRETVTMDNDKKMVMEMYCDKTGKEEKMMEVIYTRK